MKARDVMVSPVVTVKPSASVKEVAKLLLQRRISAVPVVDDQGKVVGIVSEGDLLHRAEAGTERQRPWWLLGLTGEETLAAEYVKAHARKVADVMTSQVTTATPDTPLHELATLMERNSIKRVPIVKDGQLVGIVSRANLVQAVASARESPLEIPLSDANIREKLLAHLQQQAWGRPWAAECPGERRDRRPLGRRKVGRREDGHPSRRRIHTRRSRRQRQLGHPAMVTLNIGEAQS